MTLLGQNVNSYGKVSDGSLQYVSFPELLKQVSAVDGIERLRFSTSHPKDLSPELIECFATNEKLCSHFHLPVQSGSNRVLKKMNRKYTIEQYLERVAALREVRPDIVLTTDIIVGFPGEEDEDFQATLQLLDTVRYHGAYSFKYSDRPQAKAVGFDNKVEELVKSERLRILQEKQKDICLQKNRALEGSVQLVVAEGESRTADGQWSGRTMSNIIVNFEGPALFRGQDVHVKITEGLPHSLRGVIV